MFVSIMPFSALVRYIYSEKKKKKGHLSQSTLRVTAKKHLSVCQGALFAKLLKQKVMKTVPTLSVK